MIRPSFVRTVAQNSADFTIEHLGPLAHDIVNSHGTRRNEPADGRARQF